MSDATRHKQQARAFEQREDWNRAIEAYELAIATDTNEGVEVEPSLHNRVGDLYRRIGDVAKAVYHYEAAVDGHISAGFYNNAIALCNKILRSMPNRHSIYLKLGKIGASKGFLSDARKHFLEYAERMKSANQLDEAFAALMGFADISPDPEIRLMIADQLLEHERTPEAIRQLRLGWRDLRAGGRDDEAAEVRERIMQIAPAEDPEVHPPEGEATSMVDREDLMDLPELELEPPAAAAVAEEPAEPAADESFATTPEQPAGDVLDADEPLEFELPQRQLEGDELSMGPADSTPQAEPLHVVANSLTDHEVEAGMDAPPEPEETLESVHVFEPGTADDEMLTDADIEAPSGIVVDDDIPEPEVEPEGPADRVAELRALVDAEGSQPALLVELADALLESGERSEATRMLRKAVGGYARQGEYRDGLRVIDELIQLDMNDVLAHQKRVEFSLKLGTASTIITAYLDLADCLDRTDPGNKAETVYRRVLDLDPGNQRAQAALELVGQGVSLPPPAETQTAQDSGDYVDLGSLILDPGDGARSTRFTSAVQDDEELDFSEMLDQFKSKVAEALEEEDAASHYDLGVAYKEMGLVDEAIGEFQIAARSPDYRLRALEMLGACFLQKDDYRIAIKVLGRAIQVPDHRDEELLGIYYAMGRAHEGLNEIQTALEWYERVMGCDINFADAAQRVAALRG